MICQTTGLTALGERLSAPERTMQLRVRFLRRAKREFTHLRNRVLGLIFGPADGSPLPATARDALEAGWLLPGQGNAQASPFGD